MKKQDKAYDLDYADEINITIGFIILISVLFISMAHEYRQEYFFIIDLINSYIDFLFDYISKLF